MACYSGEYWVSEDGLPEPRKWQPLMSRKCTDPLWLIIFFFFWSGLMFITGYAVTAGAAERLVFGYDSYGNICGRKNTPVLGAPLSGQDMRNKKFVFFLNSCGLEIKNLKIDSVALCVSGCPQEQLTSLEEIQRFANNNGSCLCVYSSNASDCIPSSRAPELCPVLPVPPSLSFPLFNRCIPQNVECYSQFASVLINMVNEVDIFHRILGGIMTGRDTVIGLCVLALGDAQVISRGQVEYKIRFGIRYMWWYHLVGLIWTSEFILACQQMTVAGAVVTCFFNRNKSKPPSHPVLSSISILFCYHLGTVVKGSLIIPIVRVPRIILLSVSDILKKKENACARCMFKCCCCCFWCLERSLRYLHQNAYTATFINGTNFCTSARDAVLILSKNPPDTIAINCFCDFIICLGKVFVVCFTVFGGLMAFNYHRDLHVWVVPLLLIAFLAYLVAHGFLSVFQTILDVLFLCFAVDIETNDGSPEKPYFMDQELMTVVYQSCKLAQEIKHKNKKTVHNSEYGTELQPMTRT
uniref:Choline transporter-like protein n=1 Tax=Pogona vitticeps TaxID=103695 RepID=A0ABM5G8U7_9SAUR